MRELLLNNLVTLIPIILLSVVSLAFIIYKAIYFYSIRIIDTNRLNMAMSNLLRGDYREALQDIINDKSPTADIIRYDAGLAGEADSTVFNHKIEAFARKKLYEMERFVAYLSSIANIATLMGLLGTVVGMIITFYQMMITESSDPYTLAGGISQALITTAAGLITAVPAMIFYTLFISIIKKHKSFMESFTSEIMAKKES